MNEEFKKLLELQKKSILLDKKRLGVIKDEQFTDNPTESENGVHACDKKREIVLATISENKENFPRQIVSTPKEDDFGKQNAPLVERLDLSFIENPVEREKQLFIEKLSKCENPLTFRSNASSKSAMFRFGEYSPNKPNLRVVAAPYLGLGEYEQRKLLLEQQRRKDLKEYLRKRAPFLQGVQESIILNNNLLSDSGVTKAVQTDIQNIRCKLIQYDLHSQIPAEKELSPQQAVCYEENNNIINSSKNNLSRIDPIHKGAESSIYNIGMDKPRGILSNRKVERDFKQSHVPSFLDGFSYESKADNLQRERLKRETYQAELRQQIEEKRKIATFKQEQEKREQELENRKLELQILRMQEEQFRDDQRRSRRDEQIRRNSEELARRKQELHSKNSYRKHTESESSVSSLRNTNAASKQLSHYSPPVSRRNPYSFNIPSNSVFAEPSNRYNSNHYDILSQKSTLSRMDSLNVLETNPRLNSFSRYDSLSRIDSLNRQEALNRLDTLSLRESLSRVQRRHSATQQDLSMIRRSPKMQRRNSSGRFDDSLPIPVLKVHSPVARELKNSVAISSGRQSSEVLKRLEDKWQIPAVQKNIINHSDLLHEGQSRSILTQLGAIRMQLQQEQLRMDETLRKRGVSPSKAVNFH